MPINIIVAFTQKNFGIGKDNKLPWNIPDDLRRFKSLTKDSVIIMGRKTWESLPIKPLKNRFNIIISSKPIISYEFAISMSAESAYNYAYNYKDKEKIFIIGGCEVYKLFMPIVNNIYATIIYNDIVCDTFFPIKYFDKFKINSYSTIHTHNEYNYQYIDYVRYNKIHDEYEYLNLLNRIIRDDCLSIRKDRTNVGTYSIFGYSMNFDISESIPFLTTKFLPIKTILKELIFFMKGQTDNNILIKQGVNIWTANTTKEFLNNRGLYDYKEGDMGPMYGVSFRSFGCKYEGCDKNYLGEGFDQLTEIVKSIKKDPYSRRHIMTTFNPSEIKNSVLAPCHGISIQFYVEDMYLSCSVYNRSQDVFLGMPFNIAMYSILTYIIAKKCNLKPYKLIVFTGDTHIYSNHEDQVKLQLERIPLPFPILEISDNIIDKNFEDINIDDFKIHGYIYHPSIKAPMAV